MQHMVHWTIIRGNRIYLKKINDFLKVEHNLQVESYFKYSCWDAFSPKKIKNEASTKSDVARSTSDGAYAIYVPWRE